jgi:uncharacterized protein YkuJ
MKRIIQILSIMIMMHLFICLNNSEASAATNLFQDNGNGVLTISYKNESNAKMKVAVTKDKKSYYYDLKKGENLLDIPLTMGNGTYQIRLCKNITGAKYSILQSESYELKLEKEEEVFLNSNVIVDYQLKDKAIKKAASLTKSSKTDTEKMNEIYDYVVRSYLYDYEKLLSLTSGYIPNINLIYKYKKGICYDISTLMAAMLRSQGIPVKVVTGYTPNIEVYHSWNVIFDEDKDKWITVDATYDLCMFIAGKKYKMVKPDKEYKDIIYQY